MATHRFAVILFLTLALSGGAGRALWADEAASAEADRVVVVAENGAVVWDDVAAAAAELGTLNGDLLRPIIPHGRIRLDSLRTRLALRAAGVACGGVWSFRVIPHDSGEPALEIALDRTRLRAQVQLAEKLLDPDEASDDRFGLHPDPYEIEANSDQPLVVLIHGFNATARTLRGLQAALEENDLECALFLYPNDGPIRESATLLSQELTRLKEQAPDREVWIVAHSMGGLAAREAVENPELDPGNVSRLVMIATPQHGSNLAWLPVSLDLWEHRMSRDEWSWDNLAERPLEDGFGEAKRDLRPGSPFLRRLNARPRNPRVKYSILLGSDGPLTAADQQRLREQWDLVCRRSISADLLSPRVDPLLNGSEMLQGAGDGAVSVESGQLEGVEDVEVLPFRHNALGRELESAHGRELLREVIERLQ